MPLKRSSCKSKLLKETVSIINKKYVRLFNPRRFISELVKLSKFFGSKKPSEFICLKVEVKLYYIFIGKILKIQFKINCTSKCKANF